MREGPHQGGSRGEHRPELPGLSAACQALAAGAAAIVPNPAPMTYGIVATSATTVNEIKGRPADQNVAVSLHDPAERDRLLPCIELPPPMLEAIEPLLARRISVLLPLNDRVPPTWVGPAIRDGYLAAFNGYWSPTARLWDEFPRLYGSSANLTGAAPAADAGQAAAMFGPDCAVVDAAPLAEPPTHRSASSMVRIDRTGRPELYRSGAQDAASGLDPTAFARRLAADLGFRSPGRG